RRYHRALQRFNSALPDLPHGVERSFHFAPVKRKRKTGCSREAAPGPGYILIQIYATFTSIDFGRAFSLLARRTVSTPSLNSAATFASSASSGTLKLRVKLP